MTKSLGRLTLLRNIYRALINNGRTYAAFEREQISPLLKILERYDEIFDPMAGYCTLMTYCSEIGIRTFCIESNPPAYLWGVLLHPANTNLFLNMIECLLKLRKKWPITRKMAQSSDYWFTDVSLELINKLFLLCQQSTSGLRISKKKSKKIAIALLLPFTGRLSCSVPGNMVTHVKMGGICVYKRWHEDFCEYLETLRDIMKQNMQNVKTAKHKLLFDDCRTIKLDKNRFPAMITSPPYPNSRDYSRMFAPENNLLEWFNKTGYLRNIRIRTRLIGSVEVSEKENYVKRTISDVKSLSARKFLNGIENYKGTKKAEYDNKVYYLPYFSNYFSSLERAYRNISSALSKKFEGYIIVVNNTARNQVVPVAKSIVDIWKELGFQSCIIDEMTREKFHVGGINPRARGSKAKHIEYTVKVWRD